MWLQMWRQDNSLWKLIHASSLQVNISIKKHLPIPLQIAMCILTQTQSQISASWWIFSGTFHCNCGIPGKKTTRAFGASIRTISSSVRVRGSKKNKKNLRIKCRKNTAWVVRETGYFARNKRKPWAMSSDRMYQPSGFLLFLNKSLMVLE